MGNAAVKINVPEAPFTVVASPVLTDRQVDIRAAKYTALDAEIKRLSAERDKLKAELIAAGTRSTKNWSVTYTQYSSPRFDSTRFKADHPKMYADYVKQVGSSKFSVTQAK